MKLWTVEFTLEAKKDMREFNQAQRFQINKAIIKVYNGL